MIDLKDVSYETNSRELFSDISFAINAGDIDGVILRCQGIIRRHQASATPSCPAWLSPNK